MPYGQYVQFFYFCNCIHILNYNAELDQCRMRLSGKEERGEELNDVKKSEVKHRMYMGHYAILMQVKNIWVINYCEIRVSHFIRLIFSETE